MRRILNLLLCVSIFFIGCKPKPNKDKAIAENKSELNDVVSNQLEQLIKSELDTMSYKNSIGLKMPSITRSFYVKNDYKAFFTNEQSLSKYGVLALQFINNSMQFGLFPNAYHADAIKKAQEAFLNDPNAKLNGTEWAKLELLLADGYFRAVNHLKFGRLRNDTIKSTVADHLYNTFYKPAIDALSKNDSLQLQKFAKSLEPTYFEYDSLKIGLHNFLKNNNIGRSYTFVPFPYGDSIAFVRKLMIRLQEEKIIDHQPEVIDSSFFVNAVMKYQRSRGFSANGKPDKQMMAQLNATPDQKFLKIALNLDRYKMLPEKKPETFVMVNLPGFSLRTWDGDTIAVDSRVIVGKKETRTPLITSEIYNFITNPYWSVPGSIIKKEMIPGLKRNSSYLERRNMKLIDRHGRIVNPHSINWGKYSNGIPYTVRQDYGDGNSLGVMKFNFRNAHDVYLHDTNQRYLFSSSFRALSHGCVRVQQFERLAKFIARKQKVFIKDYETESRDSITPTGDTITLKRTYLKDSTIVHADSIPSMIRKKLHREVELTKRIPIFIDYYTAAGRNGEVVLFDDIYGEDRMALEKYGSNFK